MGTKSSDGTKSSLQLHLNFVRHLTLRYLWFFFQTQSKLVLLPIFNWRLVCALYIVIDFYALQAFFGLKLLFQGTFNLFQILSERKYKIFSRELRPRIPHPSWFLHLKKQCTHNRPWICHCIQFSQIGFQTDNATWLPDDFSETFLEKTVC